MAMFHSFAALLEARLQASLLEWVFVFDLRPKGFSRGQSCQLSSLAIVLSGGCGFRAMNTFLFQGGVYGGAAQCAPQWPGCLRRTLSPKAFFFGPFYVNGMANHFQ
ncbi:hypothetical protein POTOM_060166 [Populus tomentosa]|uniref:Secreted protein n=1 Tax=Populus tomentosa TaxID=118781 RepID=A0A8X7XTQ2_POPTO|nr:hypothetical protein POTOM_060166 [Populus tomentosa]